MLLLRMASTPTKLYISKEGLLRENLEFKSTKMKNSRWVKVSTMRTNVMYTMCTTICGQNKNKKGGTTQKIADIYVSCVSSSRVAGE